MLMMMIQYNIYRGMRIQRHEKQAQARQLGSYCLMMI